MNERQGSDGMTRTETREGIEVSEILTRVRRDVRSKVRKKLNLDRTC